MEKNPQLPCYTCDVRGNGESQPDTCGPNSFHSAYGCDFFYAIHSLMLDRPYVGQKTLDVLQALNWLQSVGHTDVQLLAKGRGCLPATFAALLAPTVVRVTLKQAISSYREVVSSEYYNLPLSSLVPNILAEFDLPDCYAALAEKDLKIIEPWSPPVAGRESQVDREFLVQSGLQSDRG